jgi:DNA-binding response OmpR family regulator
VLDIVLRGEDSWRWLGELKTRASTRNIPIIVISTVTDAGKGYMLGAQACIDKPVERAELLQRLDEFTARRVLLVEDEAPLRYSMKRILEDQYVVIEAANGTDGLRAATTMAPVLVVLDLGLPDIKGEEVLSELRKNPATGELPVLIATSRILSSAEHELLRLEGGAVLSKDQLMERLAGAVADIMKPSLVAQPS